MDWVWQSEELLHGWMLPAGSALVALGLTTLVAALYARWKARRVRHVRRSEARVDLRDEPARPTMRSERPMGLGQLDEGLAELEAQVERLRLRLESAGPMAATSTQAAVTRVRRDGVTPAMTARTGPSPEARALKAFVAADR